MNQSAEGIKVSVEVNENDLYTAISELYNSGSFELVGKDGVRVVLVSNEPKEVDTEPDPYAGNPHGEQQGQIDYLERSYGDENDPDDYDPADYDN